MKRRQLLHNVGLTSGALFLGSGITSADTHETGNSNGLYQNPVIEPVFADPTAVRDEDGMYYGFTTGSPYGDEGIVPIFRSPDLLNWEHVGHVFNSLPDWISAADSIWAPDAARYDGKYYLYYSLVSRPRSDGRGIGVATADHPSGPWTDHGKVLRGSDYGHSEAIDPNLFVEDDDTPYLVWGSFGPGIYVTRLSDDAMTPVGEATKLAGDPPVEGPFVVKRNGYYYLFVSPGICCAGPDSTYETRVGRSESLTGPYLNEKGENILTNPGTLILDDSPEFLAPGHISVSVDDGDQDWMLYHAYENGPIGIPNDGAGYYKYDEDILGTNRPVLRRALMIDPILWKGGWPTIQNEQPSTENRRPTINQKNKPKIDLAELTASPQAIIAGEQVTVSATADNSRGVGAVDMSLFINGKAVETKAVVFSQGETREVSFTPRPYADKEYSVTLGTSYGQSLSEQQVTFTPKPAEFEYDVFRIEHASNYVNTITASANIQNVGSYTATRTVPLRVDGSVVEAEDLTLDPGESTTVSFTRDLGDLGLLEVKEVSIGKLEPKKVANESLQAYWRFNDDNMDSSGNEHEFMIENGAGYDDHVAVEGDYSLRLDGSDDSIQIAEFGQAFLSEAFAERTVSMWVNPDSTAGLQELYNEGGTISGLAMRINDGTLEAGVASNRDLVTISSAFKKTDWTHVAVVFDNGTLRLYKDGTNVASQSNVGYDTVPEHVAGGNIGSASTTDVWGTSDAYFAGHVDASSIHSRALSTDEVSMLSTMY